MKKRGLLYLSLVLLSKASRIAHSAKNEQRRSPRKSVFNQIAICVWQANIQPMDIYRCFVFWLIFFSLRDFGKPRNKALSKRLFINTFLSRPLL